MLTVLTGVKPLIGKNNPLTPLQSPLVVLAMFNALLTRNLEVSISENPKAFRIIKP
jgi:hypothetical protein